MANQVIVTANNTVQVSITPTPTVEVQISRAAITSVTDVANANSANYANYANFAGQVTSANQPNITTLGNLVNISVSNTITTNNIVVTGNLQVGNLVANSANYANFAGVAYSVAVGNVSGIGNIATVNLDGNVSNVLHGDGSFGPEGSTGNANYANFAGTAFSVSGANVSGSVANANYANISGTAYSVSGSNVSGAVANATYANDAGNANIANTAYSVSGANVSGAVANANYAANAGNANIANTAYSVSVGNVSGIGNIATINLDGNAGNILYGNGIFAAVPNVSNVANANYANFAGTAYSVSGSNVSGAVANATYANDAGNANIANTAYSVSGSNVSGAVANANYANDAGNANIANTANVANIANIAYSVDLANVVGIGNIANINLDGNASNLLDGTGNWVAIPNTANANFANYAGEVTTNAQPNITSTGNLVSLTVNNGIANTGVMQFDGNGITVPNTSNSVFQLTTGGNYEIQSANYIYNYDPNINTASYVTRNYVNDGVGTYYAGQQSVTAYNPPGTALIPSQYNISVFETTSNLNNASTGTGTSLQVGQGGLTAIVGSQTSAPAIGAFIYGNTTQNQSTAIRLNRRRGNSDSRTYLQGNDYLGNIEWRGAGGATGGLTGAVSTFGGKVDSAYVGPNNVLPIGMELTVINSSNTRLTHSFWANGDVSFSNTVNATAFVGNGAGLTSITGANVTGTVANATYAANAGHATTANTVTDNAQPNITSVGTLGNLAVSGNITANVITANYINANINFANVDSIYFDVAANVTLANEGQLAWDDGDGTLQLLMEGGNIVQQIGTQEFSRVYNAEANTLSKGEVVYVFGAQGNRLSVKRAQANTEATSFGTVGFVAESIASGQEGFIITSGAFRKVNTNGFTAGNIVYLSPSVAGGFTTTRPVPPDQAVILGWVERVSSTVGSIYVKVDNGYELDELHNVLIANATAGQALVYNSSNLWVNGNPNFANTAGTVTTNAQPNITSTGNLISLTIDNGVANVPTYQFNGNGIVISNSAGNVIALTSTGGTGLREGKIGNNFDGSNGFFSETNYFVNDGVNTYQGIRTGAFQYGTPGTEFVPGLYSVSTAETTSNLNTTSSGTHSAFQVGQGGFLAVTGSQINAPSMGVFLYGNTTQSQASALRFNRRRGNGDSRTNVVASDYLGNVEWRGAGGATGSLNSRIVTFGAKVDSAYGGPGNVMPIGFEMDVVNSSNTLIAHNFWANGNVTFSNTVNATAFVGDGNGLSNIAGGNVSGAVANATYATSAGSATTAGTVTTNAQPNITSVGTLTSLNMDGNITANANIIYDIGNSTNRFKDIWLANSTIYIGNANLKSDDTNNTFNVSVTGTANALVVGNTKTTLTGSNIAFVASNTTNTSTNYFIPSGNVVNAISTSNVANTITVVHLQSGNVGAGSDSIGYLRSGGNLTSPTAVANNSTAGRTSHMIYNGNTYAEFARVTPFAPAAANTSFTSASTVMTPGGYNIRVGAQYGNSTGFDNTTFQQLTFNQHGQLVLYGNSASSSPSTANNSGIINHYYSNNAADKPFWQTFRYRGNGASVSAVQASDSLGSFLWNGYNGSNSRAGASLNVTVTSNASITSGATIPSDVELVTIVGNILLNSTDSTFVAGAGGSVIAGNNTIYSNFIAGNVQIGPNVGNIFTTLYGNGQGTFGNGNINLYANGTVSANTGSLTGLTVTGNANISNLQLNQFQETVYAYGNATGTITPDFNNGSIQNLTLTGNITLNSLGNAIAGRSMTLILTQDSNGSRLLSSTMKFAGGSKTLTTTANAIDIVSVFYDGATYYATLSKGYA
jgi:hypothetical protein